MKKFLSVLALIAGLSTAGAQPPAAPPFVSKSVTAPAAPFVTPETAVESREQLSTCVTAIASQSDPAKLATLGSRQANPRLKRILYYLAQARAAGADPGNVLDQAQRVNGSFGTPRAPLVKASLLRNLKICDGLRMLTPENLEKLKRGNAPVVMRGPYTGQIAEVDHIVPLAQAHELGNELANLEMLPAALNRAKSDKVGERQMALARRFRSAGLISAESMARLEARFVPAGTGKFELREQ